MTGEALCRREAYSCWSTASSARVNNYGTRIDLILAAGPCGDAGREFHASIVGSDIWMDAYGSDHAPAYADLAPSALAASGSVPPPLSSRYLYTGEVYGCAHALQGPLAWADAPMELLPRPGICKCHKLRVEAIASTSLHG